MEDGRRAHQEADRRLGCGQWPVIWRGRQDEAARGEGKARGRWQRGGQRAHDGRAARVHDPEAADLPRGARGYCLSL